MLVLKIANTILNEYKSVNNLIKKYNAIEKIEDKEVLLKDIKIVDSERKIGKSVSKKIYEYVSV